MNFSNRFGLVPYSGQSEGRMVIVFRKGNQRQGLPDSVATVQYSSVDDAICINFKCSRGALSTRLGIKSHTEFAV